MSITSPENIRQIIEPIIEKFGNSSTAVREFNIKHLHGSLKSLFISSFRKATNTPVLILCETNSEAEDFRHDFISLDNEEDIIVLTKPVRKSNIHFNDDDISFWLIDSLIALKNKATPIIITTPDILNSDVPLPDSLNTNMKSIEVGTEVNLEELSTELLLNGFEREDFVSTQGELSIRGGILDIFPLDSNTPLRIEFFGDEIESIRTFDILSQRSIDSFDKISFMTKIYHSDDEKEFRGNFFEYLNLNTFVFNALPENVELNDDTITKLQNFKTVSFNKLGDSYITINSSPQPKFNKSIKKLAKELIELYEKKYHIAICADGQSNLERIRELIENSIETNTQNIIEYIHWSSSSLSKGFISDSLSLAYFNEHEIFGRIRTQDKHISNRKKGGITIKDLKQLNVGDLVVHDDKGIGAFDGLEIIELGGKQQDCVRLLFADNDLLYVHLNYLHKIHKFNSEEGVKPKLSKLGSAEWLRKKKRTKKKLKDIARNLIKLYAKRKSIECEPFPEDTIWQKEFEASFIYEDTPDQAKTTDEVKTDMQSPTPMDRLVCGDVGYGKTEIAIRAAFKAVQAGKQVAILVPTTILAQQHYMSFNDRLHDYPVNIDVISRFRTTAEQREILKRTSEGKNDILIGTHRLLSKDIKFKNLGLLIIDEEHRFGVGAKEKLREIKAELDTLTLTATPIPRTLNFSLMGARDLSVIETPPRNRLPIITEILEWDEKEIKEAIDNEIKRGGQVFFVSDKVEDIELILFDLQKLMPGLRFGMAHGQMPAKELEKNMERFIKGKYDVLVSTKIIESGLDIPNANTIIINRANKFGLAELYQLRGRVGRSNTQAYCYLFIPSARKLSLNALKRLQAIEEFSDLGSGFQLAMRDLEIRGAGNLLGPEQSGFINEMGFELYHKILDEAVKELRAEEFPELIDGSDIDEIDYLKNEDIQIDINSNALLPKDYIKSDKERFYYYKRLYNITNQADLSIIEDEIADRFGKPPRETEELLFAVKLRIAALNTGFTKIELRANKLLLEFPPASNEKFYQNIFPDLIDVITSFENSILKQKSKKLFFEVLIKNRYDVIEKLWRIKKTIESLI
jgi:transcription-repair coupling factor (superfamily II helicase)